MHGRAHSGTRRPAIVAQSTQQCATAVGQCSAIVRRNRAASTRYAPPLAWPRIASSRNGRSTIVDQRCSNGRPSREKCAPRPTRSIIVDQRCSNGRPSREKCAPSVVQQQRIDCAGRGQRANRAHECARERGGAAARGGGPAAISKFRISDLKFKTLDTIWQYILIRSKNLGSDTTVGIRITPPDGAAEDQKHVPGDDQYDE
ncbi:hypothetical protein F511_37380 [Dorcoceras hygrometricum]|uniref:Uncharacterized protein n=1 Tax=Dorcoceras hygrometricum TaxID=472368 RepID=A0A2Z7DHB5_9LAMI|nr:hypothetical protein F511_37380 [Dorcoceras hygrometricum]